MKKQKILFYLLVILTSLNLFYAWGVDFSSVPGVVIDYVESPTEEQIAVYDVIYIGDPEILVLSNGNYLASCSLFGNGATPTIFGTTHVFLSTDNGNSWSQVTTMTNMMRGTLFEYGDAVYLLGAQKRKISTNFSFFSIAKSTDGGLTWTQNLFPTLSGLNTPNNPVVVNERIWLADDQASYSSSIYSNFMESSSWVRVEGYPIPQTNWLSGKTGLMEGQIAAAPELGLYLLPRVDGLPYTTLAAVDPDTGVVSFNPDTDYVSLPGGGKKFGVEYDPVSERFYLLSNPVLEADRDRGWTADLIRNTAAILSSKDLRNWNVEKIYLHSTDIDSEGFQYMSFDVVGDDMVVASRTAFDVPGENEPPRAHDSNMMTFNVIPDFRTISPEHVLKLIDGKVLRFEKTYYEDAPLGAFALGTNFAGTVLVSPDGFGQDTNGDVYIHESGGRILRFDASGNFLETVASSPVSFQSVDLSIDQPDDRSTWVGPSSGDWFFATNWYYWGRADSYGETAVFGSALEEDADIRMNESYTLAGFQFLTEVSCSISGSGSCVLDADSEGILEVDRGAHEIDVSMRFDQDVLFSSKTNTSLTLRGSIDVNGNVLTAQGGGELRIEYGGLSLDGGSLVIDQSSVLMSNAAVHFNGTVEFKAPVNFYPSDGETFHIMEGDIPSTIVNQLVLPELEEGLAWDTFELLSDGDITVVRRAPESWMSQYGLETDGSDDFVDTDGDGMDNYSEWLAGTDPLDNQSYFFTSYGPSIATAGNYGLLWNSLTGRIYRIDRSTNLLANPAFQTIQSGVPGSAYLTEFIDENSSAYPYAFYRVGIEAGYAKRVSINFNNSVYFLDTNTFSGVLGSKDWIELTISPLRDITVSYTNVGGTGIDLAVDSGNGRTMNAAWDGWAQEVGFRTNLDSDLIDCGISNIPFSQYKIIVYLGNYGSPQAGSVSSGSVTYYYSSSTLSPVPSSYQSTDVDDSNGIDSGSYVVFGSDEDPLTGSSQMVRVTAITGVSMLGAVEIVEVD